MFMHLEEDLEHSNKSLRALYCALLLLICYHLGTIPGSAEGLPQTLLSGITPGGAEGTIWGTADRT